MAKNKTADSSVVTCTALYLQWIGEAERLLRRGDMGGWKRAVWWANRCAGAAAIAASGGDNQTVDFTSDEAKSELSEDDVCECDHLRRDHPIKDCEGCFGCDVFRQRRDEC